MYKEKLSELEYLDRYVLYRGLLELIKNGNPLPFHNGDRNHVAYLAGSKGEEDVATYGDSPEKNKTFGMMSAMADEMRESQELPEEEIIDSWKKFCSLGIKYPSQ